MKTFTYANRNLKELLSDPISLVFTIGLPAFLLIFMVQLNRNLSFNEAFDVANFVPATIIFSYSFLTMFSGMLIAKDRKSQFLERMFISPLKAHNYILGYIIPLLIIGFIQTIILYLIGIILGLGLSVYMLLSIPFLLFILLIFTSLGLLIGSTLKEQQVGPIASMIVQVVAFLSGMWFSLELVGGVFKTIGYVLPFAHSLNLLRFVLEGKLNEILLPLLVVVVYIIVITVAAIYFFKRNMKK